MDRNGTLSILIIGFLESLSARRAWIEISMLCNAVKPWVVALRKESVDRNVLHLSNQIEADRSLSARRAWIEMEYTLYCPPFGEVALRKESVDRNIGAS